MSDSSSISKKKTIILISSFKVNVDNIDRTDIVVGGDYSQGAFQLPMKLIYVMDDEEIFERKKHFSFA